MIRIVFNKDLLDAPCNLIVWPSNTVGVAGCGIAKQIVDTYSCCYKTYNQACRKKLHDINTPFMCYSAPERSILCVASKIHWREDSTSKIIELGLLGLVNYLKENPNIKHVALPILGSGAGNRFNKLNYNELVNLHIDILNELSDVCFYLYARRK